MLPSELLAYLGRGAPHGHYWHLWSEENKYTQWYDTSAKTLPDNFTKPHNLYFGVHPCGAIPPGKPPKNTRSQIEFIGAANCMFADVDFDKFGGKVKNAETGKDGWVRDEAGARAFVEGLKNADSGPSPHVMVFTGGGFHIYWLLDAPVTFDFIGAPCKVRDYVALLQRKWTMLMRGDPGAQDMARILRVPGSWNCKTVYDTPRKTEIVYAEMGAGFYSLPDIDALVSLVQLPADTKLKLKPNTTTITPRPEYSGGSVIELYNRNTRISDMLDHFGYTVSGDKFVRPDKKIVDGISGTIDVDKNTAYTFSSNDPGYDVGDLSPSQAGCTLTPFDLLVRLEFGGDVKAAVKAIYKAAAR